VARLPAFDPIDYLIHARFPLLKVAIASIENPKVQFDGGREFVAAAERYLTELEALTPEDLNARVADQKAKDKEAARQKAEQDEARRWYNLPNAMADYDHWAKMAMWSIDEGVALSLDRDPRFVSWKRISAHLQVSPLAATFADRRNIAMRALSAGQLWQTTPAGVFLAWAARMNLSVPDGLTGAVTALGVQIDDWKSRYDQAAEVVGTTRKELLDTEALLVTKDVEILELRSTIEDLRSRIEDLESTSASKTDKSLGAKERESLLKMVIGMAISYYGYDPSAARAPQTQQVAGDLDRAGIPLDVDTVRKYLNEAKEFLPGKEP